MMRTVLARVGLVALAALLPLADTLHAQTRTTPPPRRPAAPVRTAAAPPPSPAVMGDDSLTMKFEVSGIPVILRRVTANNVVAANLYLMGGVRQLTPETQGIELLLLEASERGTRKYPREVLRTKMARLGSAIGVSAGADWTVMGLRATTGGLDSTWAILADRIMAPRLEPTDVELVREQFVTAVSQRTDSPDALLDFLADSITFAGHPYGLEPTGTEQSLRGITLEQMQRYQREQMVTSRMMLVVVGNVSRAKVERMVRETIGRLPRGEYAWTLPEPPADLPPAYVIRRRTLPTNYLQGYFHGPKASSSDYAALRLACAVLSGRLFGEVRQRRNLTYSVNAPFVERAFSMGGLYVTTTQPDEVLTIMYQQVKALQEGIITQEGLDQLVQQFIVTYFLDNETNADQANMLARAELYQGDFRRANRFVQELRAVTPEDIQRAARTYMTRVRWAYVGDPNRVTTARLLRF
jgi:zinc protease